MAFKNFVKDSTAEPFASALFYDKFVGDAPTENWWDVNPYDSTSQDTATVVNNGLLYPYTGNEGYTESEFSLKGNFDVQVNYDIFDNNDTARWAILFRAAFGGDIVGVNRAREASGNLYQLQRKVSGTWSNTDVATTDVSGTLRLVRTGNDFTGYENGNVISTYTYDGTNGDLPVVISLSKYANGTGQVGFSFSDFVINSGQIIWPGGTLKRWKWGAFTNNFTETFLDDISIYDRWTFTGLTSTAGDKLGFFNSYANASSLFVLKGAFDISVDLFADTSLTNQFYELGVYGSFAGGSAAGSSFWRIYSSGGQIYYDYRGLDENNVQMYRTTTAQYPNDSTWSGKLRMVRSTTGEMTYFVDTTGVWEQFGAAEQWIATDVTVLLKQIGTGSDVNSTWDNLVVSSSGAYDISAGGWVPCSLINPGPFIDQQPVDFSLAADGTVGQFPDSGWIANTRAANTTLASDGTSIIMTIDGTTEANLYTRNDSETFTSIASGIDYKVGWKWELLEAEEHRNWYYYHEIRQDSGSAKRAVITVFNQNNEYEIRVGDSFVSNSFHTVPLDFATQKSGYIAAIRENGKLRYELAFETDGDGVPIWEHILPFPDDFLADEIGNWYMHVGVQNTSYLPGTVHAKITGLETLDYQSKSFAPEYRENHVMKRAILIPNEYHYPYWAAGAFAPDGIGWDTAVVSSDFNFPFDNTAYCFHQAGDIGQYVQWAEPLELSLLETNRSWETEISYRTLNTPQWYQSFNRTGISFRLEETGNGDDIQLLRLPYSGTIGGAALFQEYGPYTPNHNYVYYTDTTEGAGTFKFAFDSETNLLTAYHKLESDLDFTVIASNHQVLPGSVFIPRIGFHKLNGGTEMEVIWYDWKITRHTWVYVGNV